MPILPGTPPCALAERRMGDAVVAQHHGYRGIARLAGILVLAWTSIVHAQIPPAPAPASTSPAPSIAAPSLPATTGGTTARETELEQRLRRLEKMYEQMEQKHSERYATLYKEFQTLKKAQAPVVSVAPAVPATPHATITLESEPAPPNNDAARLEGTAPGGGADGTGGDRVGANPYGVEADNAAGATGRGPEGTAGRSTAEGERPVKVSIGNGLRFESEDEEFQMQFHDLTQAELRNFPGVGPQSPLKTQFFIPRQRWYFVGRATKNVEFYTVINRGYGSIDLLDAFINFNYDPRIQFRAGRTKTPTSYEYYQIAEGDLIAPERSLFIGNLAGNRQDGFMFHGQILEKSAEWALGVFNGPRRSFQDYNNDKDLYSFINIRPFQKVESLPGLHYFNIGGAYNFGTEDNPVQPVGLTTANDQTATFSVVQTLSPTFFKFNNNVTEFGRRAQWGAWIMWFYKSFNVLAEYDGGFQDYLVSGAKTTVHVPLEGFSTTAFYFVTGEEITRRVDVKPKKPFAFKNGKITGPGCVEVFSRFSQLNVGRDVFSGGLADPNLWTNQAYAIDTGINWYPNQYTKIYMDWQHSVFGNAVTNGPGSFMKSADLLWLRFQLFL